METITINRVQTHTQSPIAYISSFHVDDDRMLEQRGLGSFATALGGTSLPVVRIVYHNIDAKMKQFIDTLEKLSHLKEGWDGYDAPSPANAAILTARGFLSQLLDEHYEPTRFSPSVVGGIGITHRKDKRKVYIEFFNDGEIYALFSDGVSEPVSKRIDADYPSFNSLIIEMREYLDG